MIWCDAVDAINIKSRKFSTSPHVWGSYADFLSYLLEEEEKGENYIRENHIIYAPMVPSSALYHTVPVASPGDKSPLKDAPSRIRLDD